jgi:hypothetical protein
MLFDDQIEVPVPATVDPLLSTILSTKRAHTSVGDTNFRLWLHATLKSMGHTPQAFPEGCLVVTTDEKSDTLFSCHIDTCHGVQESDGTPQQLAYDPGFGDLFLSDKSKSGCLGADDGAGIYILLKLIAAKVPGSYIFHTGEERGGIGAYAVLSKKREWLDQFSRAVAFDRAVQRGESPEVIVTQGGLACASAESGLALCKALDAGGIFEKPWVVSHRGSFTDTKVYCTVIPECFNVGVFYAAQHTPNEWLSVAGLEQLLQAVLKIKWDDLPVKRDAKAFPDLFSNKKAQKKPNTGYVPSFMKSYPDEDLFSSVSKAPKGGYSTEADPFKWSVSSKVEPGEDYGGDYGDTFEDLRTMCEETPEDAALFIAELQVKVAGLEAQNEKYKKLMGF